MIMSRRLYIPTSTLNFNNIISSESISPFSFYQKRGYGFRRFEKVLPNNLDNLILLYDKFPIYTIDDKELENYPMVIEINIDSCPSDIEMIGNGIYSCSETIYLNPFNTYIYFNSFTEFNATKLKAEPSIESKFVNLYNGCYRIVNSSIVKEQYKYNLIDDIRLNEKALEKDIRINKLKGFAYSYVIAANRSYSPGVVSLKKHFRQLINALSAIITAPNFKYVQLESNEVKYLYSYIRRDIEYIEGIQQEIDQIIRSKVESYQIPNLIEILKKEELFDSWYIKIKNKYNLRIKNEISPFILNSNSNKLATLDAYSEYLNNYVSRISKQSEFLANEKLPIFTHAYIVSIPGQNDFITNILNMYCSEMIQKDMFLSNRYEYALKGGAMFKESYGDSWDNSDARKYINSLLTNLNEYTAFDINKTNNHILKSFAAFFQKGDLEIEKLEDYLIANGIGDLKLAYALWGVIFGFAEMPKTLTRDLFDSSDLRYKGYVYKYIYKSLHGIELSGELQESHISKPLESDSGNISIEPTKKENASWFGKSIETIKEFIGINSSEDEYPDDFLEKFNVVFNSENFKTLKPSAQAWYKGESMKIWLKHKELTIECYNKVLSLKDVCPISGTKGLWSKCLGAIKPATKNKKNNKIKVGNDLFSSLESNKNSVGHSVSKDGFIRKLQCVRNFTESQIERLEQNWDYTRKGNEMNPNEHLRFFINLCKKEGRGESKKLTDLNRIFTEEVARVMYEEIKKLI